MSLQADLIRKQLLEIETSISIIHSLLDEMKVKDYAGIDFKTPVQIEG